MIKLSASTIRRVKAYRVRTHLKNRTCLKPHLYKDYGNFWCESLLSMGVGRNATEAYQDWVYNLPIGARIKLWAIDFINSSKRILANKGTRSS